MEREGEGVREREGEREISHYINLPVLVVEGDDLELPGFLLLASALRIA